MCLYTPLCPTRAGAERDILRQLRPFIAKYKPSMLLSMHVFAYPDDEKAHSELQEIILSYKTVLFPNGKVRRLPCLLSKRPRQPSHGHRGSYPAGFAVANHRCRPFTLAPRAQIVDRKAFSVGGWCRLCALLLTDMELQESDVQ